MPVHFLYFLLKWKELNQQVCLIKYVKNEIYKREREKERERKRERERERERERRERRERGVKTISKFKSIFKTPENFSLVTLVTNYHKSALLLLVVRPWRKFEKQKLVLNFEFCYCYLKLVIFS